jgi:tetratricopeptide (TPR) repeat protein
MFYSGQYEQARAVLEQALPLYVLPGQQAARRFSQYILACIHLHTGRYADVLGYSAFSGLTPSAAGFRFLDLFNAHVHLLDANPGITPDASTGADYEQAEQELHNYLSVVRAQPRLDMIGMPLALLGYIAYRRGKLDEARQFLQDALENGLKQGFFWVFMLALSVLAVMLAESGKHEEAVEVYATATAHPCAANSCWWEAMFGRRLTALTASLPPETIAAAQARGRARSLVEAGQQYYGQRIDWL